MLLHALRGERRRLLAAWEQVYQDMLHNSAPSHRRVHQSDVLRARARAAWVLGDDAQRCARSTSCCVMRPTPRNGPRRRAAARWSRAFVALLDERLDDARVLLEPMAKDIERYRYFAGTQARFMLADIQLRQGEFDAAAATLRPWLEQARQRRRDRWCAAGRRRSAAASGGRDIGAPPARCRAARGSAAAAAARAGAAGGAGGCGRRSGRAATPPTPHGAALDSALSEREREVLERIAAGDSNKLIARAFYLSPHTVKRHVANILDKLGADTRGQAAARWRQGR